MCRLVKPKALFFLIVAPVFFIFMLIILLNSFPADYRIANNDIGRYLSTGSLMPLFHLASELTGEVGVILRFIGACFFLVFTYTLAKKKIFAFSFLRKTVLLEGVYYLFNIPFIIYLIVRAITSPEASSAVILTYYGAAFSYAAQLLFVTPIFLIFYRKLASSTIDQLEIAKFGALAITGFIFGLWIKHFMLALYAIGIDFSSSINIAGSLNSILTMLLSGLIIIIAFLPVFKKKATGYNSKMLGAGFILAGLYVTIYLAIALINEQYMNWFSLIDWWSIIFVALGLVLLLNKERN